MLKVTCAQKAYTGTREQDCVKSEIQMNTDLKIVVIYNKRTKQKPQTRQPWTRLSLLFRVSHYPHPPFLSPPSLRFRHLSFGQTVRSRKASERPLLSVWSQNTDISIPAHQRVFLVNGKCPRFGLNYNVCTQHAQGQTHARSDLPPVVLCMTTRDKWAPIPYVIPVNDMVDSPPPQKKKKVKQKNHLQNSTTRPSSLLNCGWSKHRQVFYNQQINKVTPHFTFLRRAQNADTHALKQHRLPPNSSPLCSSVGYRTWHASWARKRKTGEKRRFSHG